MTALSLDILGPALVAGLIILATHVPLGTIVLGRGAIGCSTLLTWTKKRRVARANADTLGRTQAAFGKRAALSTG